MDIPLIVRNLSDYGNSVVAVKEVKKKETGIKEFMQKYNVKIAKTIKAEFEDQNDIYILEADKEKFTDEVIDEIHLDYLRNHSHRHRYIHPSEHSFYRKEALEKRRIWEIQNIAKKEFGIDNPELYSKDVLIEIIDEETKNYFNVKERY